MIVRSELNQRFLEVTYRKGKALAAYFYLPRFATDKVTKSVRSTEPGLVIDFAEDGRAIGIEITTPQIVTQAALNRALEALQQPASTAEEFSPLIANG